MMLGYEFPGDFNEGLQFCQSEVYGDLISHLFYRCKIEFMADNESQGVSFDLRDRVSQQDSFDHRTLQAGHDLIAAYYRFNYDFLVPAPLDPEKLSAWERYKHKKMWKQFYKYEVGKLAKEPEIRNAVLTAAAYANKEVGMKAEKRLLRLLIMRYGEFTASGWLAGFNKNSPYEIDFIFVNRFNEFKTELPGNEEDIAAGLAALEGTFFPLYVKPGRKKIYRIRRDPDGDIQADRWGPGLKWRHDQELGVALSGDLIPVNKTERFIKMTKRLTDLPKKYSKDSLVEMATEVATVAHEGQERKGTDTPYIVHPVSVGMHLSRAGCSDPVIAAGILHDTVEDTFIDIGYIRSHFGKKIAEIVSGCSEPKKNLPWRDRKRHTIEKLKKTPLETKMVACADKLSNIMAMATDYAREGKYFWDRFNAGREDQEWYYRNVVKSLKSAKGSRWKFTLMDELEAEVDRLFKQSAVDALNELKRLRRARSISFHEKLRKALTSKLWEH